MPNLCDFTMKIVGQEKDQVEEMIAWLQAEYDYAEKPVCQERHHFFRVFDADCDGIDGNDKDGYSTIVYGNCAWSVSSCMREGGYYDDLKARYPDTFKGMTLRKATHILQLKIEVFSAESGMGFSEHYVYDNGKCLVDNTEDYSEIYLGGYETKAEAEEDLNMDIDDDEWEEGRIMRCDYDPYSPEWTI